jgi:hypothetical protein
MIAYNIWSGLIGGFFLALSYFVPIIARWVDILRQKNAKASKLGLLITAW